MFRVCYISKKLISAINRDETKNLTRSKGSDCIEISFNGAIKKTLNTLKDIYIFFNIFSVGGGGGKDIYTDPNRCHKIADCTFHGSCSILVHQ